jgi:hypothetical protein
MNIHLHHVAGDLDGDTWVAILAGELDPKALVNLRHPWCSKSTVAQMKRWLRAIPAL